VTAHSRGPERDDPAEPPREAGAVAGAGSAAERASGEDENTPLTAAEAIGALGERGAPGRDELAQALGVVSRMLGRFEAVPSLRIGSLSVFNDEVRLEEGDFNIGGGERTARRGRLGMSPLAPEVLKLHIGAFVEPPGYRKARRILEHEHLVVLAGPPHSGREACALALLAELADSARLHLIGSDLQSTESRWRGGATGGGYVASEVDPDDLAELDETWLRGAAKTLRDTGGYLVVVTGAACTVPGHPMAGLEFLAPELGLPDPMDVLHRRARAAVRVDRAAHLDAVLSGAAIADLLEEEQSPRFAARAAMALADAANSGGDLAGTVAALCDPTERVRAWFERTDAAHAESDQELSLAIAAAVLDGCSYLAVTDAATALYRRLHDAEYRIRYRRLLRSTQRWLQVQVPEGSARVHGDPMPETLEYRNPQVQPIVLAYAWTELDGLRHALIPWLRELARNADVDVRACVAASAGLLATLDFTYAAHNLILPWASSQVPALRACAALALAVPSRDPRYSDRVWALLEDWSLQRPSRQGNALACTAAEAVSGVVAEGSPLRALEILQNGVKRADWDCLTAVALGLLSLVETGYTSECLDALLDWSEDQDESPHVIRALAAFVVVARTPAALAPSRADEPKRETRSGLRVSGTRKPPGHTASASPVAHPEGAASGTASRSRLTMTGSDGAKRVLSASGSAPRFATSARAGGSGTHAESRTPAPHAPAPVSKVPAPHDEPWPALLTEADRHCAALRDLWARSLACKPLRPAALSALRAWLDNAERDKAAVDRVSGVFLGIRGLGGRHAARLEYHLEQWAEHPTEPSSAAAHIRTLISSDHR
jgi:hypothetical protein